MDKGKRGLKALNPLTSLCIIIWLGLIAALFEYKTMLYMVVCIVLLAFISGDGVGYLKLWVKSVLLLCGICFLFQSLFIPGEDILWKWSIFKVTKQSLNAAINLSTRLMGIGSAAILAVKMVDVKAMVTYLQERGISPAAGYSILATLNIIPQMSKEMQSILEAQKSRGIEMESNIIVRAKAFFPSIGPLLLNSIIRAEERAITLEARGFSANCTKTQLVKIADSKLDKVLRITAVVGWICSIATFVYVSVLH